MAPTKIKYLTNKDLLAEIHKSKLSYCCFTDPKYSSYDFIVPNVKKITKKKINDARRKKHNELRTLHRKQHGTSKKVKPPTLSSIPMDSIVIRVMTYDHIPMDPIKAETGKTEAEKHTKVNFPPFQHYKIDSNNTFICVGKSHWTGGIKTGHFSKDHGRITDKLAKMYIMLCEKYAMKYNWRGYTYRDEMQNSAILQLTYVGLRFNEAKSANPFAYYTAAITNSFCRVLNTEKRNQNIRDDILEINGLDPSWSRQGLNTGVTPTIYEE